MDLSNARWRKSTRSGASGGNCIEVASNMPGVVAVRDSKDVTGPALTFSPVAWSVFVAQVIERP
ncbi:DUF397 domain-containing protein [Micromonospora arborensis]|uniref:DUF397 domain-containing protein n=1 Tax=Micromonospora arborensis TaxID=2116518 RepID=UPI00371CF9E4